jgi:uncharacterized protein YegP (UPF0339 family)
MAARFEIHDSNNNQFRAVFKGANGETVWWTENYTSKQNAINACSLIQRLGPSAPIYDHTRSAVKR